ncbi:hypothetical protein [Nocardia brasiliensis]|uniref:hypothetical protein n=1 Tax=Nocardia brasiliensis TaxID=37326 RepID=UPI002457C753|nr:hypothetical protein [Nocardia brasiliensis]
MAASLSAAITKTTRTPGTAYTLEEIPGVVAALIYTYESLDHDGATEIHYYNDIEWAAVSYTEDKQGASDNRKTAKRLAARGADADEIYQHLDDEWMVQVKIHRF